VLHLKRNHYYILCVNNDSIFEENCVKNLVECAEKKSAFGCWRIASFMERTAPRFSGFAGMEHKTRRLASLA
jgi:GT2 family glycosyltransferase